jgi:hypothetical protein
MVMPKCSRLVITENSVVSCPPCWVADAVKAPPTLPCALGPEAAGLVEEVRHLRGYYKAIPLAIQAT